MYMQLGMDSVLKGKNVELYTDVTANYDNNKQLPLEATKKTSLPSARQHQK
jgi:hypothetical protein